MLESRTLRDLCCLTQATLLNSCLTESDLRELGVWDDRPNRAGFSPAVWCRALLHKTCRQDPDASRRLSDHLDLRFLDVVVEVRCLDEAAIAERVDAWIRRPEGRALPGLLWALCTDPRPEVHARGSRLCHEAVTAALQGLVGGCDASRAGAGNDESERS